MNTLLHDWINFQFTNYFLSNISQTKESKIYTGTETRQSFSRMLTIAKILKSCLPLLYIKYLLVFGMSSMSVVVHAGLNNWLQHIQINKIIETKKTEDSDVFFPKRNIDIKNPVPSLDHAPVDKSIKSLTTHKQKAPIYKLSLNKAPNTQPVAGSKHKRKTSEHF